MADEEILDQDSEETEGGDGGEEKAEPSLQEQLKEVIGVQVEEVGPLRKKLTITVPQDKISEQLDSQYGELRRDAAVPGFRKGRAPRRLLEKRFGGEVGETLVQQLVTNAYMAAIEKEDLKVIGDPLVWAREKGAETDTLVDVQKALDIIELPKDGPLVYSCELEVRPEFDLPDTESIPVEKPIVSVSDDDITKTIDRIRRNMGSYEVVTDGGVEADDVVLADVKMTSDGTVLKEQENVRVAARPQMVEGVRLENLGEVLQGAKSGDTRTLSGQIGDDYEKQEFRGKQAEFELRVREVQRLKLPEFDDSMIKSMGFDSQDELRNWVRSDLESRMDEEIRRGMRGQVYKYLLENSTIEVPGRLSDRQASRVLIRRMLDLYRQGIPSSEVEKHMDELKTGAQEETTRDLKLFFIMEKLSEKIEVEVSEGELNTQIAAIAQRQNRRFDRVRDELAREGTLTTLYMQLRDDKIVDKLLETAKVTEKTPEELQAAAEKAEPAPKKRRTKKAAKDAGDTAEET